MKRLIALGAALGAALSYFFDPQAGARRRNMTRDRTLAFFRNQGKRAGQAGKTVKAQAYGAKQKATHRNAQPKGDVDDVTLARKVETVIFRDADVPKGDINVNAEGGVVFLRGQVTDLTLIEDLGKAARKVQGVVAVENLLHAAGSPAPAKES
jgi:osmotically-inducible protein OsmY